MKKIRTIVFTLTFIMSLAFAVFARSPAVEEGVEFEMLRASPGDTLPKGHPPTRGTCAVLGCHAGSSVDP